MRIRMLFSMAGNPGYEGNTEYEIDDDEAERIIAIGYAVAAVDEVETAETPDVETSEHQPEHAAESAVDTAPVETPEG